MLDILAPALLAVGGVLALGIGLGRDSAVARMGGAAICIACSFRYLAWRVTSSMPVGQSALQQAWAWIFLCMEFLAILSSAFAYLFMARILDRRHEADAAMASPLSSSSVDVFIATYNEGYAILERTIVGALAIDHDDLRVWVLDDGARSWVRDLAQELGAHYLARRNGRHAKAGNINNALGVALATGRRPEFILLLDADFVAHRNILKRTLGLFQARDIGIVQTPQHFFNQDPVQTNLLATRHWPDEQRFFFNTLLPSKDAWGAAFCCGTSAVFRMEALVQSGGMAVETVTEDMLTSFKMEEHGWRTIFLNERLSLGLAPEGIGEYVSQRARWCLGAVQQMFTRWSCFGPARLRLVSRASSFDGVLYWSGTFPFKIMMISAPLTYWWTGTSVMQCAPSELAFWLLPSALGGIAFMTFYSDLRVLPLITDAMQLLPAFVIMRTVATGLIRPFGRPFKVTAKGVSTEKVTVQWRLLLPFAALALATALGMVFNLPRYSPLLASHSYAVNVFWSLFNILVLLIVMCACVELPKRRFEARFPTDEAARLVGRTSAARCRLIDISVSGARLRPGDAAATPAERGFVELDDGALRVPYSRISTQGGTMTIRFHTNPPTRRALIVKLYTGAYDNEVPKVRPLSLAGAVVARLFA